MNSTNLSLSLPHPVLPAPRSDDALLALGADGRVRSVNHAAPQFLGEGVGNLVEVHVDRLLPGTSIAAALRGEAASRVWQVEIQRGAGPRVAVEARLHLLLGDKERAGLLVLQRAGTWRGSMAKHGPQSRGQAALDVAPDALFDWDLETDALAWGPNLEQVLGYQSDDIASGRYWTERLHPDDRAELARAKLRRADPKAAHHLRFRMQVPDGSYRHVEARVRFYADPAGRPTRLVGFVSDVTEYLRLLETSRAHRLLVETTRDYAMFTLDQRGVVRSWNPGARRIKGYEAHEIIGRHFSCFYPEEHRGKLAYELEVAERDGRFEDEGWRVRKDGSRFWANVIITALRDERGKLQGFSKVTRDITERLVANQKEREYRMMVESARDYAMFTLDTEGRVKTWTPAARRIKGYAEHEIIGRHFSCFYPEEALYKPAYELEVAQREGRFEDEGWRVRKDGSRFWANVIITAMRSPEGKLQGFAKVTRDITERQRAIERVRSILLHAVDGIIAFGRDGRLFACNPAGLRMFGYDKEHEILGKDARELIPSLAEVFPGVASRSGALEASGQRRDGSTFPLHLGVGEMGTIGEGTYTGIVHDLSARKRMEAELIHSQKMEAVGTLASGVAHDFNNLLMGIIGCADLVLDEIGEDHPAGRYLNELRHAANSGSHIARQLMTFGRREESLTVSHDPDAVIRDALGMVRGLVREDVHLAVVLEASSVEVRCMQGQLEQLLVNLVVNSRQAMPKGGTLRVSTRAVQHPASTVQPPADLHPGFYFELTVSDTGCGMDDKILARAFEPFFTSNKDGGTGLGLATVYAIAKQAGGYVAAESEVGSGTTVRVYLPVERSSSQPATVAAEKHDAIRGDGQTVLVVEDEVLVRMAVEHYLRKAGYRVVVAGNAHEARETWLKNKAGIALLLTDVVLPGGQGGQELAAQLRTDNPDLPLLFMSAHPPHALHKERRLEPGMDSLQKPFSETDLLERVRRVLKP